jgi:hypothetical protein
MLRLCALAVLNFVAVRGGLPFSAWRNRSGVRSGYGICTSHPSQEREGWGTRAFEVVRSIARSFEVVCLETLPNLISLE